MRMRDIPRKLWINDSEWKIKFVKIVDGDAKILGCCNSYTKEIHIKVGLAKRDRAETLIHELLHALEFEYGIEIDHKLIYQLERPVYNLCYDNFAEAVK